MTYSLVIPANLIHEIYLIREAKITPSIRNFILAAIEMHLEGIKNCGFNENKNE